MTTLSPTVSPHTLHPIWPHVAPARRNRNAAANAARLLHYCGHRLVLVLPEEKDKPGTPADIYGVTPTGMLSWLQAEALINEAADGYGDDCESAFGPNDRDYDKCLEHAINMKGENVPQAIRRKMVGVVVGLLNKGLLPPEVVIKRRSEIDADLTTIGTKSGVLELATGRILPPDEARERFVCTTTDVEYDPEARHPEVDQILLPVNGDMFKDEMAWYRAAIIGYGMANEPAREFMWEICAADSGKSTFVNTLREGLGWDYISEIRPEALRPDPRRSSTSYNGDLLRLGKPSRFTFVIEFEGRIDSGIIKGASGGDDIAYRRIYLGDDILNVTSHLWFTGNPKDEDGPQLGITNDDENTRAILGRAKMLYRDPIPNPDRTVVNRKTDEFRRAILARVVEYTMACAVLSQFPPAPPSSRSLLETQRRAEMADWQRDWVPGAIRARDGDDGPLPEACVTALYDSFRQWWRQYGTGRPPGQKKVTEAVNSYYGEHHGVRAAGRRCPQHGGKQEGIYRGYVIPPISLIP